MMGSSPRSRRFAASATPARRIIEWRLPARSRRIAAAALADDALDASNAPAARSSSPTCSRRARRSRSAFPAKAICRCSTRCTTSRDRLRFIVCRQEGGAAYMAEAYGKLTGRPGIAFVTRGPGASNAAIGIHTAAQDSTPMIVFVGQVGSDFVDREAFQEIDYRRMYGSVAKWAAQIDRAERIPEYVAHAYRVAMSGRPGPGRARAAGGHAGRARRRAPMRRASMPIACRADRRDRSRPRARCSRGARGRWCSSAAAAGTPTRCAALRALRRSATGCRSRARSATRTSSTTAIRNYAGDVGIGINPAARRARARRRRAARDRRAAGRDDDVGLHAARRRRSRRSADPRASRRRTSWAASTSRRSRSPRRPARSSPR